MINTCSCTVLVAIDQQNATTKNGLDRYCCTVRKTDDRLKNGEDDGQSDKLPLGEMKSCRELITSRGYDDVEYRMMFCHRKSRPGVIRRVRRPSKSALQLFFQQQQE